MSTRGHGRPVCRRCSTFLDQCPCVSDEDSQGATTPTMSMELQLSGTSSDADSVGDTPPGTPSAQLTKLDLAQFQLPFSPPPGQQRSTLLCCPFAEERCPFTHTQGQKLITHLNQVHVPTWTSDFVRNVYVNKALSYPSCVQLKVACCACVGSMAGTHTAAIATA